MLEDFGVIASVVRMSVVHENTRRTKCPDFPRISRALQNRGLVAFECLVKMPMGLAWQTFFSAFVTPSVTPIQRSPVISTPW